MDSLRPRLEALVDGDESAGDEARARFHQLRAALEATGIEDDFRSLESSTVIVKWPEASLRAFNTAAFTASVQYGAVLAFPNADNLQQGIRAHEDARRAYGQIH
jgi:hypothetical protein